MNLRIDRALGAILGTALAIQSVSAAEPAAQIRYTGHGIAHVQAADYQDAGYGLGYAFARENLCAGVELALTLAGERSAAFGEDGQYLDPHLGTAPVRNLDSDLFAKFIYTDAVVASMRSQLSPQGRALVSGYVRGFNQHLASLPAAQRPRACRAAWVRPLTEEDVYRRINQIAILQSTHLFLRAVASAQPPAKDGSAALSHVEPAPTTGAAGSNMAAFGRRTTQNGRGLSFSNPHFPWSGPQRLYAAQITVPGRYDVFGGMLYGTPFIVLGFNKDIGWSITYSTNHRFSLYRLDLSRESPTTYLVDAKPHAMQAVSVAVPVRTSTGRNAVRSRTFYRTVDGPVLDNSLFPWTAEHAFVIKDANRDLGRWPDQFLQIGRARSADDVRQAAARIRGMMFSNVAAADRNGKVMYANFSQAINMPDADLQRCLIDGGEQIMRERYVVVLDGSRSQCAWRRDGDAIDPEIIPARRSPWTVRDDYVLNANDSHWLVNADPKSALEGFDRVIGAERQALGDRTRTGLRLVERRLAGADGLGGNKMTLESMRRLMYSAQTVIGESIMPDAVRDCRAHPQFELASGAGSIDLSAACEALAGWDGTARPQSRGAVLAREFIERLPREVRSSGMTLTQETWRAPFDAARPIETPAGLSPSATTRRALVEAAAALEAADVRFDAPLREAQFLTINGERVPVGGFPYTFLRFTPVRVPNRPWSDPLYISGDSYIHAVTFDDDGPVADVVVSYSQSTDADSEHSWDLTLAYAQQRWIRVPFLDRDIRRDADFQLVELDTRQ